jgi:hypothetical protein
MMQIHASCQERHCDNKTCTLREESVRSSCCEFVYCTYKQKAVKMGFIVKARIIQEDDEE